MTTVCMYCLANLGEKCPGCGAIAQPLTAERKRYGCPTKRCTVNTFPVGDGGETHTVCDSCAALPEEQRFAIYDAAKSAADRNPECERHPVGTAAGNGEPAAPAAACAASSEVRA